jgi:hypothetical protein
MYKKTMKALDDFKIIWIALSLIITGSVYAFDLRYMVKTEFGKIMAKRDIMHLRQEMGDLQVQQGYSTTKHEMKMYETLIKMKETQILGLKGE